MGKRIYLAVAFFMLFAGMGSPARGEDKNDNVNIDFEDGIAGWKDYSVGGEVMSQSSEEAHSGKYSLKVETAGANSLEGVVTTVGVSPMARYLVSVYAKGQGKIYLCTLGSNGWIYGKKTDLTSEWQELKLGMFARINVIVPNIITAAGTQKAIFYLDDLKVVKVSPPALSKAEVEPIKFEAENYYWNAKTVTDSSASGGAYAEGFRWYELAHDVPYPQTATPVYIYLKVWLEDNVQHTITITHGKPEGIESLARLKVPAAKEWKWLKAGPFQAGEILEKFTISTDGPKAEIKARVDSIVISTKDNLTDKELDAAKCP